MQRSNSVTSTCPAPSGTGPDMESTRKRSGLPASHQSVREPWSSPSSSSSLPSITLIFPTSLHLLQHEQWQLKLPSDYYRPDTWYPLPCLIFRKFTSKPSWQVLGTSHTEPSVSNPSLHFKILGRSCVSQDFWENGEEVSDLRQQGPSWPSSVNLPLSRKCVHPSNIYLVSIMFSGFPCGSDGKETVCSSRDVCSISGSGRSPGERNGNPLQCFCLKNSKDRGAFASMALQRVGHDWATNTNTHVVKQQTSCQRYNSELAPLMRPV